MQPFGPSKAHQRFVECAAMLVARAAAALLLFGFGPCLFALDPNLPPGRNFDLSHWYLTLPDASATMIKSSSLTSGYTNAAWFYTGGDGAMTFFAPVNGGTTANSQNARSELRELIDGSDTSVNWSPSGTHILDAQCRILQVPSTKRAFIGQIHGYVSNAPVLVLLKYDDGQILTQFRVTAAVSNAVYYPMADVDLGDLITYRIKFTDGILSITVNGHTQTIDVYAADPAWRQQKFYFKAGAYNQDNEGTATEGTRVAFYKLNVVHQPTPPSITSQPSNQSTNEGGTVSLRVSANGTMPLAYQWWKDGQALTTATNPALAITNATDAHSGSYVVVITNEFGAVTSAVARLSVWTPAHERALAEALSASNLIWKCSGTMPWTAQSNFASHGSAAAQSGDVTHSQSSSLQTTVTGPGVIGFWWKVSCEPSNDKLLFYIGTSEKSRISGESGWQWKTFTVSSGTQTLKWTYSKNSSVSQGLDRGWLDRVVYVPDATATSPQIVSQPRGQTVTNGSTVAFSVVAIGSSTLKYQWRRDGTNLASGATSATLTLTGVDGSRTGRYSVVITNTAGAIASSDALLNVLSNATTSLRASVANNSVVLECPALTNTTYRLECRSSFSDAWQPVGGSVSNIDGIIRFVEPVGAVTQKFYRVVSP